MNVEVREQIPGLSEANRLNAMIKQAGITDVEFKYDSNILPQGMWAVCQTREKSNLLLLPGTQIDRRPFVMWWVKDREGKFRIPNDQDLADIITTVKRAHTLWHKGGNWLADQLDEQDEKRRQKSQEKISTRIKDTARDMDLYRKLKRERNL